MAGTGILLFTFFTVTTTHYHIVYTNWTNNILIISCWIFTMLLVWVILRFIDGVFWNLDKIYNKSLYATKGLLQSGIAPKILHRFIDEELIEFGYLLVFQRKTNNEYLQYHHNEAYDPFTYLEKLIASLNQKTKIKNIKFKIDEKHFGLFVNVAQIDMVANNYFENFLNSRSNDSELKIYEEVVKKFNSSFKINQYSCGVAVYGLHSYSIDELVDYAKFAIHWSKLKKLKNKIQIFNYHNYDLFDTEYNKIKNLEKLFNLYNNDTEMVHIKNSIKQSKSAMLKYNIYSKYKYKSFFNRNVILNKTIESDFKRYYIYIQLRKLEKHNKYNLTKLYFEYPWSTLITRTFDINMMINNLKATAPKIQKNLIINIVAQNQENKKIQNMLIIFQKNNIKIGLDVGQISDYQKLNHIIEFYLPDFVIINQNQQGSLNNLKNISIITNYKNQYFYQK